MAPTLTPGARMLREWLEAPEKNRSQAQLGETLGVSQPSVSAWLRGESRPEDHHREAIELVTGIPRAAWRRPVERDAVERVRAAIGPRPVGADHTCNDFTVDRDVDFDQRPTLTGTEG